MVDEWWVPGGRVLYGEKRLHTAQRKLKEECGLVGEDYNEIKVVDFIFRNDRILHDIGTLYEVKVQQTDVLLDGQSSDHKWLVPEEWLTLDLSDFIKKVMLAKLKTIEQL